MNSFSSQISSQSWETPHKISINTPESLKLLAAKTIAQNWDPNTVKISSLNLPEEMNDLIITEFFNQYQYKVKSKPKTPPTKKSKHSHSSSRSFDSVYINPVQHQRKK
jgi:hypothetical protein